MLSLRVRGSTSLFCFMRLDLSLCERLESKLSIMRNRIFIVLIALVLSLPIGVTPKAYAAELSALGFTLNWDEETFYLPTKCTYYTFDYRADTNRITTMITIQNQYGEIIGAAGVFSGDVSGKKSMMICDSEADFTGTKVVIDVKTLSTNEIVSAPIVFKVREKTKSKTKDKTIMCKKGKESLKVSGKTPKCPTGYKLKK